MLYLINITLFFASKQATAVFYLTNCEGASTRAGTRDRVPTVSTCVDGFTNMTAINVGLAAGLHKAAKTLFQTTERQSVYSQQEWL